MKQAVSLSLIISLILPFIIPLPASFASELNLNRSSDMLLIQKTWF